MSQSSVSLHVDEGKYKINVVYSGFAGREKIVIEGSKYDTKVQAVLGTLETIEELHKHLKALSKVVSNL